MTRTTYVGATVLLLIVCNCADPAQVAFEQAKTTGTIPAWEAFLKSYPESGNTTEANSILARLRVTTAWEAAQATNTVEAYKQFLTQHEAAAESDLARAAIVQLQKEQAARIDKAFKAAFGTMELDPLDAFLKQYPNCARRLRTPDLPSQWCGG